MTLIKQEELEPGMALTELHSSGLPLPIFKIRDGISAVDYFRQWGRYSSHQDDEPNLNTSNFVIAMAIDTKKFERYRKLKMEPLARMRVLAISSLNHDTDEFSVVTFKPSKTFEDITQEDVLDIFERWGKKAPGYTMLYSSHG